MKLYDPAALEELRTQEDAWAAGPHGDAARAPSGTPNSPLFPVFP